MAFADDPLKKGVFGGVRSVKRSNDLLMSDLKKMQSGDLGMSQAEKQQAISNQTEAAGRNIGAQQMQLGQLAAANPFAAAQLQTAARQGSGQIAQQGAAAAAGVDQLSSQMAQQEAERIRAQLEAQRERARENTQFAAESALELYKAATAAQQAAKETGAAAIPVA